MVSERNRNRQSYWADFPETYRAEQIATIAPWIAVGDSGVVVGGSGTGKSNLVGFISTRPEVICRHLPGQPDRYLFLHIDINSLPAITTPYFYRGMLFALQNAAAQIDAAMVQEIRQGMAGVLGADDIMGLHFVLQQAHDLIVNQGGKQIVWLMDRFDEACIRLEASTLNSLRNLRDHNQVKGRLSYLIFTRHPLARLRAPRDYDEFHEILISNICWVGPMVQRDAAWMAAQMAERHQVTFSKPAVDLLIQLSGGLPAFMKAACTALATGTLLPGESSYTWLDRLLSLQPVQRNCQEMWDDLRPEEQNTLSAIAAGEREDKLDAVIIHYLEQTGLLARAHSNSGRKNGTGTTVAIFSPIFELFVMRQRSSIIGDIAIDPGSGALKVSGRALMVKLTPPEYRLLTYLVDHKGQICTTTDLIAHIWQGENSDGTEQETQLSELVQQLVAKLEQSGQAGIVIQSTEGQGYRLLEASQPEANRLEPIRIAIDEDKFQQQVQEIVDSDFFQNLQVAAHRARSSRGAGTEVS